MALKDHGVAQQAAALDLRLKRTSIEVKTGEARNVVDSLVKSVQELDVVDDAQSDTSFDADQVLNSELMPKTLEDVNVKVDRKESVSAAPYLAPVQTIPDCLYEAIYDFEGTTVNLKDKKSN